LGYCGKKEAALHVLKVAVDQNYCGYSTLLSDRLLVVVVLNATVTIGGFARR
jgi:hypothetical protein